MNISPNSCDVDEGSSFNQALTDAKNNAGPDTIRLGSAPITTATGFSYIGPDPVAIVGSGGRAFGQSRTSISDSSASPSGHTVLKVVSPGQSTISGVGVVVPGGSGNVGIDTNGAVSDVAVDAAPGASTPAGVVLESGGSLSASEVTLPTDTFAIGVLPAGTSTAIDGTAIRASHGIQGPTSLASGSVRHSEIVSSVVGVGLSQGSLLVEDSVLRNTTDAASHDGVVVSSPNGDASVTLDHVTMIGAQGSAGDALLAAPPAHTSTITFRNGIFTGYGSSIRRTASSGATANVTTDYSDYSGPLDGDSGAGAITETNHLTADPGFLSATDLHLRADSPLIDAGDPAALSTGESATDFSGQPRITDGNGDCSGRRDIGAYEFQPGPRAPRAVVTILPPPRLIEGSAVGFDASASCDPDGDSLTYAWTFDDAATAAGVTTSHLFATPGPHFGTVTVTDSTGRSATDTASVFLTAVPAPVPFAGVKIAKQTVRVSKRGVASVKVSCPASTAAGPCAGRLTLLRRKASFTIVTGKAKKVGVRLSKSTLKALRKKRRLTTTATALAHDANAASKTTHGKVTLLTPR